MLMHLDLDCRFGLIYMINTMRKKNAFPSVNNTSYIIMHTLEHYVQWNVRISFQSKTYFLDFHSPSFKKKKKERALILSLFIQGNKEDRIFLLFHPVLSTDKSIRARKNRPNYPNILSLLHFFARAIAPYRFPSLFPLLLELIRK